MGRLIKINQFFHNPLFDQIKNYLESDFENEKTVFLFVPYIRLDVLQKLVVNIKSKIVIVTTWNTDDILTGSSELTIYPYCKEKKIALYINNKIHLKIYSLGFQNMIIATGNISNRGLMPKGNYECASYIKKLSQQERLYFEKIRKEARLVNDEFYNQLFEWYNKQDKRSINQNEFDNIVSPPERDNFLISALPMTKDISKFVNGYEKLSAGLEPSDDQEIEDCIFHDLVNYEIEFGLSQQEFLSKIKKQFFNHPFIQKIDEFIDPDAHFGRIKEWIQNNCTDVPIPSRRELTGNVQVLLEWFEKLGDGKYVIDVPGTHSQRIRKVKP